MTALSRPDLEQQVALGLSPESKYVVVRNGIDCDRFSGSRPRVFEGSPLIGAVGRFSGEKGHRYLIEAMALLAPRLPGARLVLVGYGALEGDLKSRAAGLGVDGRVTFAGERDSAELLGGFDLFIQPSLYESQGLAILEAMAAGVPVIASDVGGVRDAVTDGRTGVLIPPADPRSLADAILRLAADPELSGRLAAAAARDVRERFSLAAMIESYAGLYRDLCR
jgi:glycosyltransferase involved in cell wall biosynthesis